MELTIVTSKPSKFLSAELAETTKANEILQARIRTLEEEVKTHKKRADDNDENGKQWKVSGEEYQAQFNDLKERLAAAEAQNQKMRGYISRVQEDDCVRESMVEVGDPDGERQLVPKRKMTKFEDPSPFSNTGEIDHNFRGGYGQEPRRKAKNWITY